MFLVRIEHKVVINEKNEKSLNIYISFFFAAGCSGKFLVFSFRFFLGKPSVHSAVANSGKLARY